MTNHDKKEVFLHYWRMLVSHGLDPLPEYRFGAMAAGGPGKGLRERLKNFDLQDWRFDWAWPEHKIAVEVEGGVFVAGGHTRGAYYTDNCRKYNAAACRNWLVFRFTPGMLRDDPTTCVRQVLQAMEIHALEKIAAVASSTDYSRDRGLGR